MGYREQAVGWVSVMGPQVNLKEEQAPRLHRTWREVTLGELLLRAVPSPSPEAPEPPLVQSRTEDSDTRHHRHLPPEVL